MNGMFDGLMGDRLRKAILAAVVLFSVFLAVTVIAGAQGLRYIGAGVQPTNIITVSGYGEAFGAADIATFSFSVVSEKSTVAAAQGEATNKINAITKYLKGAGVAEKDIQTTDYSVNPQYDYVSQACSGGYCPGGRQVLRGYQVRQTTSIKVRDLTVAGDLLAGVGGKGATEVSGLQFTFDDPNQLQNDARGKAIADAKTKADELAKQLGVTLVRVVSFNEGGGGQQVYYAKSTSMGMGGDAVAQSAPEISVGQNKVSSTVSITYEIR